MRRRLVGACFMALILVGLPASSLAAAEPLPPRAVGADIHGLTQQDPTGDGRPEVTVIDAAFVTDRDRVLVYDGSGDMRTSASWWEATDFHNDTWVFDVGADDSAQLIVQFRTESGNSVAYLWDDTSGDGAVGYEVNGAAVRVTEAPSWALRVEAAGDWLLPNGTLNPNLSWTMDGCGSCGAIPEGVRDLLRPWFPRDGNPDYVGRLADENQDGVPDYLYSVMVTEVPATYGIPRSGLTANPLNRPVAEPEGYVFWPLLSGPRTVQGDRYFERWPMVGVSWQEARVAGGIGGSGYPTEAGYHVNTLSQWYPDRVNDADFENVMAYYDLAGDQDNNPELHVRVDYTPEQDPFIDEGRSRAMEGIRYSWNQTNAPDLMWDYKLGLTGLHVIEPVQTYGPYQVRIVPYGEIPSWVVGRQWETRMFVAREGEGYTSSEGIYEWGGAMGGPEHGYLNGRSTTAPEDDLTTIREGYRGEVTTNPGTADVYFSPIDARLHLVGAERGVYNVDDTRRVEVRNLDGDDTLDLWQRFDGDQLTAQLFRVPGGLLYAEGGQVTLIRAEIPAETFRTLPPTNHDEWLALGQQLDANRRDIAADDLGAMAGQFAGERLTVTGATLRDLRADPAGYRFILDLQAGYNLGGFPLGGVTGPGSYAVTYDTTGGAFSAQPLTPAAPAVEALEIDGTPTALQSLQLTARLANGGLEDMTTVPFAITAQRPGEPPRMVAQEAVDLLGGERPASTASWTPPGPGTWTLRAVLFLREGAPVEQQVTIDVAPAPEPSWQAVITGAWPDTLPLGYLLLLLGLALLPVAGGFLLMRRTT